MPDIGLGELIVIGLLALLVFGPDRLPKVAADAARILRQVRQMATSARRELADAAGVDQDPELAAAVRDLRELDPRRVLEPLEDRAPAPRAAPGTGSGSGPGEAPSGSASAVAQAVAQTGSEVSGGESGNATLSPDGGSSDGTSAASPRANVDPDWT